MVCVFNAIGRKWLDVRTSNCYLLSSLAYRSKPEWKEITSFLCKIQLNCRLCCSRGPLSPLLDTVSLNLQYHYYFLLLLRNKKISNQEIKNLKKTPIRSKTVVSIYEKKKTVLKELCHEIQLNQEITKCSLNQ